MARVLRPLPRALPPTVVSTPISLNSDDKDLDFVVRPDGQGGRSLDAFMWSGCRANYGVVQGKAAFAMRIDRGSLSRVGWGTSSAALSLGQCDQSFGYGGTAKKSHANQFIDYGQRFGPGDTIVALLDADAGTVGFMKNGVDLGEAWTIPDWLRGVALFPHVLTKDCHISVFFGPGPGRRLPVLPPGYQWIALCPGLVPSPWGATRAQALELEADEGVKEEPLPTVPFGSPEDTPYAAGPDLQGAGPNQKRLLMLVGLPCSGKTYWAKKFIQLHPEMKFQILSTNLIMERKMPNTKHMYADRFNKLIQEATEMLQQQLKIASKQNGNIIWDQTNVYPSARRRKLAEFKGFRKTAIVFLPDMPTLIEWRFRQFEQTGQRVPDKVVAEMSRAFTLPEVGDEAGFDEVIYAFGNSPANRRELMRQYKEEAEAIFRGTKRMAPEELPEDAPALKQLKKDDYLKSYGERQFMASNPYQPHMPYKPDQKVLPPPQRQLALVRDIKADQYVKSELVKRPPIPVRRPGVPIPSRLPIRQPMRPMSYLPTQPAALRPPSVPRPIPGIQRPLAFRGAQPVYQATTPLHQVRRPVSVSRPPPRMIGGGAPGQPAQPQYQYVYQFTR